MRRLRRSLLALCALGVALPGGAQAAFTQVGGWGSLGTGPGQFGSGILGAGANRQYDDPAGIALSPTGGTVYVVDTSNNRVQRFTPDGGFLGAFGYRAQDKGSIKLVILKGAFFQPEGLSVGSDGLLYIADAGNDRVMVRNGFGVFHRRISHHGSYPGELVQPWATAVGPSQVYVADQGNYRIRRFSRFGRYLGSFSTFGRAPGQVVTPYGVAVNRPGNLVYVTDLIRNKLMIFTSLGTFIREVGVPGTGAGEFRRPAGVAVGPDGTVYVAERCGYRVQRFEANGDFIETFGQTRLAAPTFLAVDNSSNVYVSDYHRVVKFAPTSALARQSSPPASAAFHNGIDIGCRHVPLIDGGD